MQKCHVSVMVFQEMQSILAPWKIDPLYLTAIFDEAIHEVQQRVPWDWETGEHLRLSVQSLILWKILAPRSALWIDSRTHAGNDVPLEFLAAAYSMWRPAETLAARHHVDSTTAGSTLAHVTHMAADRIAKMKREPMPLAECRKYIFVSYRNAILEIVGLQGTHRTVYVDMANWVARRKTSDQGAFIGAIEDGILCSELLNAMPSKCKTAAVARYILGYSWQETADAMGTTVNTAQKELSLGIRQAVGACARKMRKMGHRKLNFIESHLAKTRTRLSRKAMVQDEN